ncbi:DUF1707 domain-containing protein [Tsukamurella sp. 8F]|uniref:DUF1707 SHOCT-like domain-containing protein n=1 Tax=unclassified Tsukamurella TaxID=2633480 RepID=UPI0023B8EF5C|nr:MULTISPECIES: DUF1707 domain-containing protein [unclassified Tsukamurella]MDF0532519.1 DUF1707 domain-containing protein [Tsukamurella sp. 8J]MDF0589405.1 DUF1707 domain-containing protein [Tsukamurella sp. 8F]
MGEEAGTGRELMRASDQDRNLVMQLLSQALDTGRLTFSEFEDRTSRAVAARTYSDLDRLVSDIPAPMAAARPQPTTLPMLGTKVAVMSEAKVRGAVAVGAEHSAFAWWGGVTLDLSEATFTAPEVTITATAIMAGIKIILPADAVVHVPGLGIMGAFEHKDPRPGKPGGPRVTVRGIAFWGGVEVVQR